MNIRSAGLRPHHQILIHMIQRWRPIFSYDLDAGFVSDIGTHDSEWIKSSLGDSNDGFFAMAPVPFWLGGAVPENYFGSFVAISAKKRPA